MRLLKYDKEFQLNKEDIIQCMPDEDWLIVNQHIRDFLASYYADMDSVYIMPDINEYPILFLTCQQYEPWDEYRTYNEPVICTEEEIKMLYQMGIL